MEWAFSVWWNEQAAWLIRTGSYDSSAFSAWQGFQAVFYKGMEPMQLVTHSLVADQRVLKKGMQLRQRRSLRLGKKTGH